MCMCAGTVTLLHDLGLPDSLLSSGPQDAEGGVGPSFSCVSHSGHLLAAGRPVRIGPVFPVRPPLYKN